MKTIAPLVIVSALFLSACASLGTFQDMDVDHDGAISRDEASPSGSLVSLFNSADENDDGVLDEEEYALVHQVLTQNSGTETKRRKMMTEKGGP